MVYAFSVMALLATSVSLDAAGGKRIPAEWTAPAKTDVPASVLVVFPEEGTDRKAWGKLADKLSAEGVGTLVLDHGALADAEGSAYGARELTSAFQWLRGREDVDPAQVVVAGSGAGALVALAAAANHPDVAGLALLSPRLDPGRVDDESAIADYGDRPLLVTVARGDRPGAKAALVLDGGAKGEKRIHIAHGSRKGAALVGGDDEVYAELLGWIRERSGDGESRREGAD